MPSCCTPASNGTTNGTTKKIPPVTEPYLDLRLPLGEGPHYHPPSQTLRFVDIIRQELHTVHIPTGPSSHKIQPFPHSVGITADIENRDDVFVLAGKTGYSVFNPTTGSLTSIHDVFASEEAGGEGKDDIPESQGGRGTRSQRMRFNDGAVDSKGRFWAGSMNDFHVDPLEPEGAVYRLDTDLACKRVIDNIAIPNGMGWSLDNKTMYLTDSPSRKLYSYPFDADSGLPDLSQRKDFFTLPDDIPGVLDGMAQDVEGNIWTTVHDGGRVLKISERGELLEEVRLPARKLTCPVFVGEELFVTSAAVEGGREGFDGAVFMVEVGVRGLEKRRFGGGEALGKKGL